MEVDVLGCSLPEAKRRLQAAGVRSRVVETGPPDRCLWGPLRIVGMRRSGPETVLVAARTSRLPVPPCDWLEGEWLWSTGESR